LPAYSTGVADWNDREPCSNDVSTRWPRPVALAHEEPVSIACAAIDAV